MRTDRLEIEFDLDWKLVVQAQKFLVDFFNLVLISRATFTEGLPDSLSVVLMELMENVMKYAAGPPGKVKIEVDRSFVSIEVGNHAIAQNISLLTSQFSIISAGDAREAYVQKMLATAKEETTESSRLGLARIRVESQDNFHITVSGNFVTASVRYPLQ